MKIKVAVFFGGKACEHEISCISANQVLHALDPDKYEIIPIYIAKNQNFYTGDALYNLSNYANLDDLVKKLEKIVIYKDGDKAYYKPLKESFFKTKPIELDVAFLVMHGTNGEDGTLQGMMEMLNLPYTSSGVLGAAIGQDKVIQKEVLTYEGLPLVPWFYFTKLDYKDKESIKKKALDLGYPIILKPANLGSSIGIEVVYSEDELNKKVKEALNYDHKILVEKYIPSFKEVNCSIIGDDENYRVSVLEEVLKEDEILSFENKYVQNAKGSKTKGPTKGSKGMASTSRRVPAEIGEEVTKTIQDYALKAYKGLNAYGCARIDFMIDDSDNSIYLTELNTIPGSLAFYLWDKVGVNFSEECDILINNAIKRYRDKEKMSFSFDTNILSTFKGGN